MAPSVPILSTVPELTNDRRGSHRQNCTVQGRCQPVTALEAGNNWPIQARDISERGVAIVVCRRFEPGTLLAVNLTDQSQSEISMPLARVQRVVSSGTAWLLGCIWADEVEGSILDCLLKPPQAVEQPARPPKKSRVRRSA
jgi:hypothetical protein